MVFQPLCKIAMVLAIFAAAAFSQPDDVFVPETQMSESLVQEASRVYKTQAVEEIFVEAESAEASFSAAKEKMLTMLDSGKTQDECVDSAEKTIKGVFQEVKNAQKMLDNMDNGSKCANKGKPHVEDAKKRLTEAFAKLKKKNSKESKSCVDDAKKALERSKELAEETRRECRCAVQKNTKQMWTFATSMTAMRERTIVREMMLICIIKARMKSATKTTTSKVAPADPCKKWKAEHKANAEIAKALKAEVKFGGGSTKLKDQGKKTLDNVAKILNKYPWMTITVEGHSDAPKGARCTALTIGRAAETEKYLKSKGVKNKMTRPIGKCGKKRAIEIIGNAAGRKAAPKGCGLRAKLKKKVAKAKKKSATRSSSRKAKKGRRRAEEDELVQDFSEAWSSIN
jgi:outer membrane protein OmpA-like peptidoglycan-associated protein